VVGALALVYGVSWGVRRAGGTSDERRETSDERVVGGKETAGGPPADPKRGPAEEGKSLEKFPDAPRRVLVVDDMAVNRLALGGLLERAGVGEVRQAGNGAEALDGMKEWVPDLVFTDMWMPIMDGQELAEAMRKDARLSGVPVVAVTADDEAGETYSLKAFAAVMVKPVTGAKLVGAFGAARTKGRAR
jgi:CheY-like chemotaxis protein